MDGWTFLLFLSVVGYTDLLQEGEQNRHTDPHSIMYTANNKLTVGKKLKLKNNYNKTF